MGLEEEEETWFGHFQEGDEVLRVTKLEALAPGSVTFENRDEDNRCDTAMLVFTDDVPQFCSKIGSTKT